MAHRERLTESCSQRASHRLTESERLSGLSSSRAVLGVNPFPRRRSGGAVAEGGTLRHQSPEQKPPLCFMIYSNDKKQFPWASEGAIKHQRKSRCRKDKQSGLPSAVAESIRNRTRGGLDRRVIPRRSTHLNVLTANHGAFKGRVSNVF